MSQKLKLNCRNMFKKVQEEIYWIKLPKNVTLSQNRKEVN